MTDNDVRLFDQRGEVLIFEKLVPSDSWAPEARWGSAVLDDQILTTGHFQHPLDRAVERLWMGA